MITLAKKILQLVSDSGDTTEFEVAQWQRLVAELNADEQELIFQALQTLPGSVKILTQNLMKKMAAISNGDRSNWKTIIAEDLLTMQSFAK